MNYFEKVKNWFAILNWGEGFWRGEGGFFAESETDVGISNRSKKISGRTLNMKNYLNRES